jgi:hypothetical protein
VTAHGRLSHQLPGELDLIRIDGIVSSVVGAASILIALGMKHEIKTATAYPPRFVWKQSSL